MSEQERKLDAAEFVIGTMSVVERSAFEASIETDATTRDDVMFWERTFGALNASVSPEPAPPELWGRIEKSLIDLSGSGESSDGEGGDGEGGESRDESGAPVAKTASVTVAANDNVADALRRSMRRWRLGAIAASIAALALGAYIVNSPSNPLATPTEQVADKGGVKPGKQYIAVVNANGDQPSLVVSIDGATGDVTVRSVGVERPEGKSLEVWYVPDAQLANAVSVGLVGEGNIDLRDIRAKDGDLLAISVEPPGGSPTGSATGDIIYTGTLIENVNAN